MTREEVIAGIDTMIGEVRAKGGEPAALVVQSREVWTGLMGPDEPMNFRGLDVLVNAWAPDGNVLCVTEDLAAQIRRRSA